MPGGRPSTYRESYPEQARKLCRLGAIDVEIADFFEVDVRTILRWKHDHPEFCRALKIGKAAADALVEKSLYQRAVGYSHDATKIFQYEGDPVTVDYVERYPPDTTACIFWLKNRNPERWRDRQELTGASGGPIVIATGVIRDKDEDTG